MAEHNRTPVEAEDHAVQAAPETRKPYARPEIMHELTLETRAGTPLSTGSLLGPEGLELKK